MADLLRLIKDTYGEDVEITERRSVSGGDINKAYLLTLSNGGVLFAKVNKASNKDFFRAEEEGLAAMRETGCVRVPSVIGRGSDGEHAFLLMESIKEGRASREPQEELGVMLARMHKADTRKCFSKTDTRVVNGEKKETGKEKFGFFNDNYIGANFQDNTPCESWVDFFIQRRLRVRFEDTREYWDREGRRKIDLFLEKLPGYLEEPGRPSLLHGDLWSGNYMIDDGGRPWLIDPACYVGHAEADIAMTELFGGFDRAFYSAYKDEAGLDPGYSERRDIYNLYHLLNHLALFGGMYFSSCKAVIERFV